MIRIFTIAATLLLFAGANYSQARPKVSPSPAEPAAVAHLTSSAAYAEIALRQTEIEAELESLLLDYTEEFPKVKDLRQGLAFLQAGAARLASMKTSDSGKFTAALGKLVVRKAEVEVDHWRLKQTYADNHPEVRRATRKVEIFEKAIKQILG